LEDEDGLYLGRVEEIGTSKKNDTLYISNRKPNAWVFNIINGYRQLGLYKVPNPHELRRAGHNREKEDDKIIIRVVDNESGNILTNAKIYLDGIEMLNDSLVLRSNKNYEIRASLIGYSDLVETINLNQS